MIKRISSCSDWYFVAPGSNGTTMVRQVAAWGLNVKGEVVGMLAVEGAYSLDRIARLSAPPQGTGAYLTLEQLNEEQKALARRR